MGMDKKLRNENLHSSYCPSDIVIVIVSGGWGGEMGGFWWRNRKGRRGLEGVFVNAKMILKCGPNK